MGKLTAHLPYLGAVWTTKFQIQVEEENWRKIGADVLLYFTYHMRHTELFRRFESVYLWITPDV